MKRLVSTLVVAVSVTGLAYAQQKANRGTAEASVGSTKVTVDYGRAELKGRTIDSLIAQLPQDRIWRAGVNEVTTLTATGPFTLGGKKVAAGKYSVYVYAPATGDWSLILNSDPGIELGALGKLLGFNPPDAAAKLLWPHLEGYQPNPAKNVAGIADKEVARATMKAGAASPAVDPFTISLKPAGSAATLTLAWGDKSWSVDLKS
jgi:hypothetical protein